MLLLIMALKYHLVTAIRRAFCARES